MSLLTAQDIQVLDSWGWYRDYRRNRQIFIDMGKIVFHMSTVFGGSPPNGPNVMEQQLINALQTTDFFKILCNAKRFARSSLYPYFASALARYMLDNEWGAITQP